ncbi:MAG: multi-sensor signal transduction histidine [Bacteroidetes bacterium]|nr:MAG: multi-sensor signal transduction histidine [Bacteroidota bacterium]
MSKARVDRIFTETAVLTYCIDEDGKSFAFSFNGNPLGDELTPEITGLPAHLFQGYISTKDLPNSPGKSFSEGYEEQIRTVCQKDSVNTFVLSRFPLPPGGNARVLVSLRDITPIKALAGEKISSELLLGLVAGNMTDVFCVMNLENKLVFLSPSVEKLTGYTVQEMTDMNFFDVVDPEFMPVVQKYLDIFQDLKSQRFLKEEDKHSMTFELQIITKNKETRWAEISAFPYTDLNNRLKGAYGVIRDISEHKIKQEAIQSSLQYEIELSQVKSKYISSVSHEFRTPLSIIYSNLQLLESHLYELDAETLADSFELSKMAVKSLLRVLDKVTIIDATGKGKLEFKPALVNLPELIEKIVRDLNELEIVPGRIIAKVDPVLEEVFIDEYLFNHIFSNLLLNALNYSDKKQFVEFSVFQAESGFLRFEIKDNGIGIPLQDLGLIFEPFYRAANSRYVKGSGLGLAVVKECLKLHNGIISIDSTIGEGSTVKVNIPFRDEETEMKLKNKI